MSREVRRGGCFGLGWVLGGGWRMLGGMGIGRRKEAEGRRREGFFSILSIAAEEAVCSMG